MLRLCSPKHGPVPFTVLKSFFVWMLCSQLNTFKLMAERAPEHLFSRPSFICGVEESFRFDVMQTITNAQTNGRLCSPKHGPGHFTMLKNLFRLDGMKHFKNIRTYGWAVLPQTRPSSVHGVEDSICLRFCSHVKTFKFMAGPRSPTSPVTAQLSFRRWRIVLFWCYADIQQRSNERMVVLPQTRSKAFHGVEKPFLLDSKKLFKNIRAYGWVVFPQTRPSYFHGVDGIYFYNYFAAMQKHSSLWLGRAPQHPLSRPSSFRGVEESFRSDVMQTFNNVQANGWSCFPKRGPGHVTVLKNLLIWMVWNFSKTFKLMIEPCSPKHGPVLFTVLKTLFVLMFGSHVKTFKFMAGPRSPTSPVTAQLFSRRWRIVSFWCCADIQHCSNERMVVLPQTRSKAFHGVDDYFYRVGMNLFKNIRTYGLVVLPQTRPSSFHRVEKPFRLKIKRSSLWLGRAPQHPLSRPSLFRDVEESFRFDVMQTFNNVQMKGFSKTLELMVGPCSSKHDPVLFTVLKNFFVWMLCSHVKTFKFTAGPHFPTSSVTAQLILRRWRIVSLWCCADFQQRSNERIFVLPQTRSSSFHGVENFSHLDGKKLFKNTRTNGWAVLPQTRPSSFHGVEWLFRLDVMQLFKHIQVDGWAAFPNFFCHGPAYFAALRNRFVSMLCRHSTTFKWTDVRALLNTIQSISRCWRTFFSK